jgi:hypothetical protein
VGGGQVAISAQGGWCEGWGGQGLRHGEDSVNPPAALFSHAMERCILAQLQEITNHLKRIKILEKYAPLPSPSWIRAASAVFFNMASNWDGPRSWLPLFSYSNYHTIKKVVTPK